MEMGRNDNLPYSPYGDHGGNENLKKWQVTLVECYLFFFPLMMYYCVFESYYRGQGMVIVPLLNWFIVISLFPIIRYFILNFKKYTKS